MNFDQKIDNILNNFVNGSRIFCSEAEFQFKLAWELQKVIEKNNLDFEVFLEYPSAYNMNYKKIQRIYTDILLKNREGNFIPIELKYKTALLLDPNGRTLLTNHGATDFGRFDYLWDVERIQILKYCSLKTSFTSNIPGNYILNPDLNNFINGYAIMLTNDSKYWTYTKQSLGNKSPIYKEFCIGEDEKILNNSYLNWPVGNICVTGTWREMVAPLVFDKDYICNWHHYSSVSNDIKNNEFKYLKLMV